MKERNKEIIEMSTFEVTDEIKERVSNYQIFKMHDEIKDLKSQIKQSEELNQKMFVMFAEKLDKLGDDRLKIDDDNRKS